MSPAHKTAMIEMLKEVGRLAFFGALSAVLTWATVKVSNLPPNGLYAIALTVILRAADKYVHYNENMKANGLAPF
jgi:hypothetical protein